MVVFFGFIFLVFIFLVFVCKKYGNKYDLCYKKISIA